MSLDLTRQSLLNTLFYFVLLTGVFWGGALLAPAATAESISPGSADMPLGLLIDRGIAWSPLLGLILSALLVFVNSFFVTRVVIRNVLFLERTYMPAIVYLLVSSGYYSSYLSFRPLLVAFLLLAAAEQVFRSYRDKSLASGTFLTVGFLIGLTATIYAPALFFVALIPVALLLFRLFDIREWVAALGGWGLALFFGAYGVWLAGGEFGSIVPTLREVILTRGYMPDPGTLGSFEWTFIGSIVILTILALFAFLQRRRSYKPQPLRAYLFFIWMLIVTAAVMALAPCGSVLQLPVLGLPLAVIIPTYFNSRKASFISNFLYVLMVGCAIVIHLLPVLFG